MLGLRAAYRNDTGVSAAEMTYGQNLRLPGDFYEQTDRCITDSYEYVKQLRKNIRDLKPKPIKHRDSRTIFVHPDLNSCSHVFLRNDMVRKPLQPPYNGPFKVLKRMDKYFCIQLPERKLNVSIDRLKPAYFCSSDCDIEQPIQNKSLLSNDKNNDDASKNITTYTTRSGRVSKRPVRFA